MNDAAAKPKRRKTPWIVGSLMVGSLAFLVILQSTNLWKTFTIESTSDLLLLYALTSLNFVALVIFGFIFLRSIIKLVRERRTFQLGAQIKTRLLIYFFAVSLLPIIAMAVFSYLFMNRALERWFSQIPENTIRQARQMEDSARTDRTAKLALSAKMLAATLEQQTVDDTVLSRVAEAGDLAIIEVLAADERSIARASRGVAADRQDELNAILAGIHQGRSDPSFTDGAGFDVGSADMSGGRRLIIIPDPLTESSVSNIVDSSVNELEILREQQLTIRRLGLLTLGVLTFLLMFASSWIAFYVARGLTAPIKALAEGAGEIAKGNLGHRVDVLAEDELAILVNAFNEMSSQLDASSTELSERRRYIETVLDSLPTGVISFDALHRVSTMNDAAAGILGLQRPGDQGLTMAEVTASDQSGAIERLVNRAKRVGHASDQTVLKLERDADTERTVAITASALPANAGVVLVIEDLSELIAAQRASAWQEVARRMAHEIKNPLTPIQLSAERIAKRFERSGHTENGSGKRLEDRGPIGDVVHESTETILREVTSLKTMVDEFSRFARLPQTELAEGDLAEVIRQSVATFEGRSSVHINFAENGDLPPVMQDGEQLKRVFVNLIDNAVEAFDPEQADKLVTITARHEVARDLVVAEVSDNGKGIAPSDLQKLFQPYFSTKGRGTGLGLAIVKRIISEHHGRINVVGNHPQGAKFIIELPVNN